MPPSGTTIESEFSVPVPWGHIAGKTWNDPKGTRVLLVHGLQDNAASFDPLVPLLPDTYYFVAFDLPGHGKSSHFEWGLTLKTLDFMTAIERVVDFLGWNDFIYIGHSLGGIIGFFYCAFFPNRVRKFVAIDIFVPIFTDKECADNLLTMYTGLKDIEKRVDSGKPPEYSFDEAVQRLIAGRKDPLSLESARGLAKRCLEKSGSGYKFSTDQRLKIYGRHGLSKGQTMELMKRVECPILQLIGTETQNAYKRTRLAHDFQAVKEMLEKKLRTGYRMHFVEGGHNLHMDFPHRVSGLITSFLVDNVSRL